MKRRFSALVYVLMAACGGGDSAPDAGLPSADAPAPVDAVPDARDCGRLFDGVTVDPGQVACLETCGEVQCCDEYDACASDPDCLTCVQTNDDTACGAAGTLIDAILTCLDTSCPVECADEPQCNPIAQDCPNTAAGDACDANSNGGYICYPPPNDVALCGTCDVSAGPFCVAGATCLDGVCAKYCCDAGDCGAGATCEVGTDGVGFCVVAPGGAPDCEAPPVAPSGGSCYTPPA